MEASKKKLKQILDGNHEEYVKEIVQGDFDKFFEVWNRMFLDKGGRITFDDVQKEILANVLNINYLKRMRMIVIKTI